MASMRHILRVPLDRTTMTAEIDIELVYTPEWHVRMWVGKGLLRMAAWVLGCNFHFLTSTPEVSE